MAFCMAAVDSLCCLFQVLAMLSWRLGNCGACMPTMRFTKRGVSVAAAETGMMVAMNSPTAMASRAVTLFVFVIFLFIVSLLEFRQGGFRKPLWQRLL